MHGINHEIFSGFQNAKSKQSQILMELKDWKVIKLIKFTSLSFKIHDNTSNNWFLSYSFSFMRKSFLLGNKRNLISRFRSEIARKLQLSRSFASPRTHFILFLVFFFLIALLFFPHSLIPWNRSHRATSPRTRNRARKLSRV